MHTDTMHTDAPEGPSVERLREELGEVELRVLTSYTLADAMREGSSVTGRLSGGYVDDGRACALGAAFVAAKARGYVM